MKRIIRLAGVAALGLAVAACGKGADTGTANLSDADNMLVPADENVALADDGPANAAGANDTASNAGDDAK